MPQRDCYQELLWAHPTSLIKPWGWLRRPRGCGIIDYMICPLQGGDPGAGGHFQCLGNTAPEVWEPRLVPRYDSTLALSPGGPQLDQEGCWPLGFPQQVSTLSCLQPSRAAGPHLWNQRPVLWETVFAQAFRMIQGHNVCHALHFYCWYIRSTLRSSDIRFWRLGTLAAQSGCWLASWLWSQKDPPALPSTHTGSVI